MRPSQNYESASDLFLMSPNAGFIPTLPQDLSTPWTLIETPRESLSPLTGSYIATYRWIEAGQFSCPLPSRSLSIDLERLGGRWVLSMSVDPFGESGETRFARFVRGWSRKDSLGCPELRLGLELDPQLGRGCQGRVMRIEANLSPDAPFLRAAELMPHSPGRSICAYLCKR